MFTFNLTHNISSDNNNISIKNSHFQYFSFKVSHLPTSNMCKLHLVKRKLREKIVLTSSYFHSRALKSLIECVIFMSSNNQTVILSLL